jgi:hypothetical protein
VRIPTLPSGDGINRLETRSRAMRSAASATAISGSQVTGGRRTSAPTSRYRTRSTSLLRVSSTRAIRRRTLATTNATPAPERRTSFATPASIR